MESARSPSLSPPSSIDPIPRQPVSYRPWSDGGSNARAILRSLVHSCSFGANEMSRITNSDVVSSATSLFSAPFSPLATGEAAQCRAARSPEGIGGSRSVGRSVLVAAVVSCYRFSAESCVIFQRLFLGPDRDRLDDDKRLRVLGYDRGVIASAQSFHNAFARNRGRKR